MKRYDLTVYTWLLGPIKYKLRHLKDGRLQIWHESIYMEGSTGEWREWRPAQNHFSEPASALKQLVFILEEE